MPNLVGTAVAVNYLKAQASTTFGTRELLFLQVDMGTDVATGYTLSNSLYSKAIRGLQTVTELYGVGTPSGNVFAVIASATTAPLNSGQAAGDGAEVTAIKNAVDAATGATSTVWNARLTGWGLENNC